jgi:hypothetical protein
MRRRVFGLAAAILLVAMLVPETGLAATAARNPRTVDARAALLPPDQKMPDLRVGQARRDIRAERQALAAEGPAQAASVVGDEKFWLAVDFISGSLFLKEYTLRGLGNNIEVWVASDDDGVSTGTDFPAGDCRNGARTEITDDQVNYLIDEFDDNILPKESDAFSVAPDIDGSNAFLPGLVGLPDDYYTGDGDDTVVLVDNVRDENFYDTDNQNTFSYVAGFFASVYAFYLDRNAMTIDAFDWLHRTGANPPHEPTTDPCTSAPARPFLYEGVFAHEYQHLLESYEDAGETTWVNEGLSDWAQTLTGYVDPSIPITDLGSDSHVQCFLGWLGVQTEFNPIPRQGGPEQSLNLWGDQTDFESEVLCDYGAAYTMMELLADRFGEDFMGELHRDDLHGFESLQGLLDGEAGGWTVSGLIDTWAAMAALDGVLDDGAILKGGKKSAYRVSTLDASINWDTSQAYDSPGAPPNGSDFIRLRNGGGYLRAGQINRISFDGVSELPSLPIEWVVDPNPPDQPGDAALFGGNDDNLDRSIVQEIDVPAGSPELTFDASVQLEPDFDYGYVQVSTDGGDSYQSIECSDQVPGGGPFGPAFNGHTAGFIPVTCDLTGFAGTTIVVAFRLVTDGSVHEGGLWIDDVAVDGTLLSDGASLAGWSSPTQFNPIDVEGYTVRLVAIRGTQKAWLGQISLDEDFNGVIRGGALRKAIGFVPTTVAAIVTYHDGTEQVLQYAPYTLRVNGVIQPGG